MSVSAATLRAPGAAESLCAALAASAREIVLATAGVELDDTAIARPHGDLIVAYIAMGGDLDGLTCVVASSLAREFASRVYGIAELADDLIREAACELANVIAGHAAGVLADHGVTAEIRRPPQHIAAIPAGEAVTVGHGDHLRIVLHRSGGGA